MFEEDPYVMMPHYKLRNKHYIGFKASKTCGWALFMAFVM